MGGCTVDEMGDVVNVKFHTAMEHTSGTTYTAASWSLVDDADMFYFASDNTGSNSSISGSIAEAEVCGTMTAKGNVQDGSLSDNEMMAIDEASPH